MQVRPTAEFDLTHALLDPSLAACKSKFAKVACQLIVEQMHLILASTEPGSDGEHPRPIVVPSLKRNNAGPNHKGQLLQECDLAICRHSGKYSTQQHWSCCGHKRHEPCICPATPAPPQDKGDSVSQGDSVTQKVALTAAFQQHVGLDLAKLMACPDKCGFPGTTFEEKQRAFIEVPSPPPSPFFEFCFLN